MIYLNVQYLKILIVLDSHDSTWPVCVCLVDDLLISYSNVKSLDTNVD